MTYIIYIDTATPKVTKFEDPQTPRELVKQINCDTYPVHFNKKPWGGPHVWATIHRSIDSVIVVPALPKVRLTPRLYDVLFLIVDGMTVEQIALALGLRVRSIYYYEGMLKERFGVCTRSEMVFAATEYGIT